MALPPTAVNSTNAASWLYGADGLGAVDLADPAEAYHEASKMYPHVLAAYRNIGRLAGDRDLQHLTAHAARRLSSAPLLALPAPHVPPAPLPDLFAARQTCQTFVPRSVGLETVSALLYAAAGVTRDQDGRRRRAAPSAGALYPLDVYVVAPRVDGLEVGAYHYHPPSHAVESLLRQHPIARWAEAMIYPDVVEVASVLFLITAAFTRAQMKYGLRAYRFALLEAGHIAQNTMLAANALGIASRPVGGFYDARVDALLGVDGVNEASIYLLAFGHPAPPSGPPANAEAGPMSGLDPELGGVTGVAT